MLTKLGLVTISGPVQRSSRVAAWQALLDAPLVQAAENVVPVARTSAESVNRLRQWADGRCLSSEMIGVYRMQGNPSKRRRSIDSSKDGPHN